jgi:hypothetical protein
MVTQIISVTQSDSLDLSASAKGPNNAALTIVCRLVPANGQLCVILSGASAPIPGNSPLQYPYPFFASGQSNASWAVLPIDSGFVVPVSATNLQANFTALANRSMQWLNEAARRGGDRTIEEVWSPLSMGAVFIAFLSPFGQGHSPGRL